MGLMFMVIPNVLCFVLWGTTFENSPETMPRWFYLFFGVMFIIYRVFDEIDGKQARKTGNGSALGMLFDHGVDGFCITLLMLPCMKFMSMGDSTTTLIFFSASISLFFFPILEEYYVGGIFFGVCNPITDGSVIGFFFFVYIACFGNSAMHLTLYKEGALWENSSAVTTMDAFLVFAICVVTSQVLTA